MTDQINRLTKRNLTLKLLKLIEFAGESGGGLRTKINSRVWSLDARRD